jgi:precorrin-6Y C5,15-methyltransferase (decarboxylating)
VIHIVGYSGLPLPPESAALVAQAHRVVAPASLLEAMGIAAERRLPFHNTIPDLAACIRMAHQQGDICILASGDPLLFGLGASLVPYLAGEAVRIWPAVSSLQLLAAALARPWHNWRVVTIHGRNHLHGLWASLTHAAETVVFTDPQHGPAWLGRLLLEREAGDAFLLHVGEGLGTGDQRICTLTPAQAAGTQFAAPNLVLIERTSPGLLFPFAAELAHDGTITKPATRALALGLLDPCPEAVFWDVGAGSGLVGLDAVRRITYGQAFAIEPHPKRRDFLRTNRKHTRAWMLEIIPSPLAEAAPRLPPPSHVFWGGGMTESNLSILATHLLPHGRIVASMVRLEAVEMLRRCAPALGLQLELHHLQHAVAAPLAGGSRLVPSNPVFLALLTPTS